MLLDPMTEAFDGREDSVSGFRPDEGLGGGVVGVDKRADVRLQLPRRGMYAPAELLACQFGEPALDLVEPRGRGRRKVDLVVGSARQPRLDGGGLVGGVVVQDDVNGEPFGDAGLNLFEEGEELPSPMPPVTLPDDEARSDIERGEQGGRAVPDIGMGTPLGDAR